MKEFILPLVTFLAGFVPTILMYLGIPNIISNYIKSRWDKKMENFRIENEKELQRELEKIKQQNLIEINNIQHEFQKKYLKIQQDFSIKFETLKKQYDVLPVLFEKVIWAYEESINYYKGEKITNKVLKPIAELRNYSYLNKFFISENIYISAKELEESLYDLMILKNEIVERKEFIEGNKEVIELSKKISDKLDIFENLVQEKLNNEITLEID